MTHTQVQTHILNLALTIRADGRAQQTAHDFLDNYCRIAKCNSGAILLDAAHNYRAIASHALIDKVDSESGFAQWVHNTPDTHVCYALGNTGWLIVSRPNPLDTDVATADWHRLLAMLGQVLHQCLQLEEARYRGHRLTLATRAGGIGIWEYDLNSKVISWDKEMLALYELEPGQFHGTLRDFLRCVDDNDKAAVMTLLNNVVNDNIREPVEYHFRIRTHAGNHRKLAGYASLTTDSNGNQQMIGVNYDITELELARTQSLYRSQLENLLITLSMKMIRADAREINELTTEALRDVGQFVGADRSYRMDYNFSTGLIRNTHEWCADGISPQIQNLQAVPMDDIPVWVNTHVSGLPYYCTRVLELPEDNPLRQILEPQHIRSIVTIPLIDGNKCTGFIGFDAVRQERHWNEVDLTILKLLAELLVNAERKQKQERELREANRDLRRSSDMAQQLAQQARTASDAKSRFVARVSHEMRTPLHAILGLTTLARERYGEHPAETELRSIHEAGTTLLEIINDVLDFSKVESNEIKLNIQAFSMRDLLEKLQRMFTPLASQKGLDFTVHCASDVGAQYLGDALRIRQILNNFLSNAIKFTSTGSVQLSVGNLPSGDLTFSVRDTGIGISAAHQSQLFDPFYQVDDSDNRHFSGTGLGLSIAKLLADKMHGDISVHSCAGKGSEFRFKVSLPAVPTVSGQAKTPTFNHQVLPPLRILLAEDNAVNQRLTQAFLATSNITLDIVDNGERVIEALEHNEYDVLLLDCQMPVMDGYQTSAMIRRRWGAMLPIIAITASALENDKALCLNAGMNDVLTKPFSKIELLSRINHWVSNPES